MIQYFGNEPISEKIKKIINEMVVDEDLTYTIKIYESREDGKISKLLIEVTDIQNSMPNF